jgi:hypothetical protein
MFMNAKDAPFATAMAVLLLGVVRAFDEYPSPSARSMVLVGVGLGLAFGSRVLAGIAAPEMILALTLVVIADWRASDLHAAMQRLGRFIAAMWPSLLIGYLITGLLWPWSVVKPLNPLHAAEYFDMFFEKPWDELYEGRLYPVPEMPATYLPHMILLKLPEILLALGLIGLLGAVIASALRSTPLNRRASLLAVALAAAFPVALAMATHPAFYNGLRHFVFIVPPFAVLGGMVVGVLAERAVLHGKAALAALIAIFIAGLSLPVIGMARLHPYEYTYYNALAGGVRGAHNNYMLDYWGLSFKQAVLALRAHLAETHAAAPPSRRWVVAICGPQNAAQAELRPSFDTTFDEKKADFVMSLGTFYCQDLNLPVLAKIARDGVVYATVYDVRGRPEPKLLTRPPP